MKVRVPSALVLTSLANLFTMRCMPDMTTEDLRAMRPEHPPELDKLNAVVGRWEWEGQGKSAGLERTVRFTGKREPT